MKLRNLFIIFLIMLLSGCSSKEKELKYLICKDSIQYWNYEWARDRAAFYGFTFSFSKNGKVLKYSYNKITKKRRFFNDNYIPGLTNWKVSEDSILTFYNSTEKIIKYSEDTIYTFNIETKKKAHLVRVKDKLLNIVDN